MKKILLSLLIAIGIGFTAQAQTKTFIQAGVSAGVDKVVNENLELGFQSGSNRVSFVGQSFDTAGIDRQYLVGVKYANAAKVLPSVDALFSIAAKTNTEDIAKYVIEPGLGLEFKTSGNGGVSFIVGVSSPISQSSVKARQLSFAGNAAVKFTF